MKVEIIYKGCYSGCVTYKYGGKELDTMNGLNQYDFGARQQDPALGIFTSIDPMAEKYPSISPYDYCAGNPILYVDPDGRDIAILITDMHIAMLIQDKNGKWKYYSVNGDNMYSFGSGSSSPSSQGGSGFVGGDKKDNTGEKSYNSAQEFLKSKDNKESYNYSEAYVIETTPTQDRTMEKRFKEESEKDYNLATQNCATAVYKTVNSAGINSKIEISQPIFINQFSVVPPFSYTPPDIYNLIKINNNGRIVKKK